MNAGGRWAGVLLRLYPRAFRDRFGAQFRRTFVADWIEAAHLTALRRAGRCAALVGSALAHALLERLTAIIRLQGLAKSPARTSAVWGLGLDLRSATRDLLRSPAFTALTVVTLAAGIGINVTAFTVLDAVALRDLPYPDAQRLAAVTISDGEGSAMPGLSLREFRRLEERTDLFAGVGGIRPNYAEVLPIDLDITGVESPEKVQGIEVSTGLLPTLGIDPVLGRSIAAEDHDDEAGRPLGYMLSYEYWQRGLNGDPDAIGKTLMVEYRPRTIVGVLPPDTRLYFDPAGGVPERADLWTRIFKLDGEYLDNHHTRTIVRLRDDIDFEQAAAALDILAATLHAEHPEVYGDRPPRIRLTQLQDHLTAGARPLLTALLVAVGMVLLISCANAGSLILARSRARERDYAVRRALGASRAQIGRLMLTESLLLAGVGALLGIGLAAFSMRAVVLLASDVLPRAEQIGMSAAALAVAAGLALFSGLLSGALAMLQQGTGDAVAKLRQGTRMAGSRRAGRYRGFLTVVQTAVAVILLIGAGLMLQTLWNLANVDLGFEPEGVLTYKVEMNHLEIPLGKPRYEFFRDVAEAVADQSEFEAASAIFTLPASAQVELDGYGRNVEELEVDNPEANYNIVLPGYFETMGIRLLHGRDFSREFPAALVAEAEDADSVAPPAEQRDPRQVTSEVVIDELIAERLWPGEDAVGRTLVIDLDMRNPVPRDRVLARVVGVAAHTRHTGVRADGAPQIWVPHWHRPFWGMNFVAKLRGGATDPVAMGAAINAVQRVVDADPDAVLMHSARPLRDVIAQQSHDGRLLSRVLGVFSALALLLAATGLYGVVSYATRQRTREVGIRMATGAQRRDVALMILTGALRLSAAGVVLGVVAAIAVSRVLSSLLFGVAASDPLTYAAVAVALFLVGVIAALRPAMRAAATDPVEALRAE